MQRIVYAAAFLLAMMLNAVAADPWGGGSGSFAGGTVPGATTFSSNVRIDGTLDQRGNITNGGSSTCFTGVTNVPCFGENVGITTSADALLSLNTTASNTISGAIFYVGGAQIGSVGGYGSTVSSAQLQNKTALHSRNTTAVMLGNVINDIAAGSNVVEFCDGSNCVNSLGGVDGAGNLSLAAGATRSKGTITLAAGTGTATVTSGCTPSCVDTTAVAAVRCVVATTTLTATGTGTDVIAYHCF